MLLVNTEVRLELWDAPGVFRLLSCACEKNLHEYKEYNDSLFEVKHDFVKPTRRNDWAGVYILYFRKTAKFYIGSSKFIQRRVEVHFTMLKNNYHYNDLITRAYENNNRENPDVIFIKTYTEDHARKVEQRLIDLVFMDPYCLNQRQMVEEYRPATESTREKLSKAAGNQWRDEEFKKRIQAINAKPENLARRIANGKKLIEDPEYLKKLSDASKKLWDDPEYAAKIKESGAAVWKEEGFKERHKAAMQAKWADPEYKARVIAKGSEKRRKPVVIDGVQYSHIGAAAATLGIPETTLRRKYLK